jgi:pimeloyl-ACP methyl ester carboxylesterase
MTGRVANSGMQFFETGAGSPLIFVHGALSDFREWRNQIDGLAAHYRCISVSLRGYYPDKSGPESVDAESHVCDLVDFINSDAAHCILVGHSRGGRLALETAARCGGSLRGLVLFEAGGAAEKDFFPSSGSVGGARTSGDLLDRVVVLAQSGAIDQALATYIDAGHGGGAWSNLPDKLKEIFRSNVHTFSMMKADRSVPLSRRSAALIQAPTLLLEGGSSPVLFRHINDILESVIANTERGIIYGGDHFSNWTHAQKFNLELERFLGSVYDKDR